MTFDWLLERIHNFLKLEGLFEAKGNVPAKTILYVLNLDSWQKLLLKNRYSVGNIGFWCGYIIIILWIREQADKKQKSICEEETIWIYSSKELLFSSYFHSFIFVFNLLFSLEHRKPSHENSSWLQSNNQQTCKVRIKNTTF